MDLPQPTVQGGSSNLELSWKPWGSGHLAKSPKGYYLAYLNTDPEVRAVRWYVRFEPQTQDLLTQEKWALSRFFDSLNDAQRFCEKHAEALES